MNGKESPKHTQNCYSNRVFYSVSAIGIDGVRRIFYVHAESVFQAVDEAIRSWYTQWWYSVSDDITVEFEDSCLKVRHDQIETWLERLDETDRRAM